MRLLAPNLITAAALLLGCGAMARAAAGDAESAVVCVLLAALLDGLDGTVARALDATSRFGAAFDAINDFITFGIAVPVVLVLTAQLPVALVPLWTLACGWRLQRADGDPWFRGAPAPIAALLGLTPLIAGFVGLALPASVVVPAVAAVMIAPMPTVSLRAMRKPEGRWLIATVAVALAIAAALVCQPWWTLLALAAVWLLSVPLFAWRVSARSRGGL